MAETDNKKCRDKICCEGDAPGLATIELSYPGTIAQLDRFNLIRRYAEHWRKILPPVRSSEV